MKDIELGTVGLTRESLEKALETWRDNPPRPEKHSIEGLKSRIVFCLGQTIAILVVYGYVFCVDERFLEEYKMVKKPDHDRAMRKYTDDQLKEQGVL